MNYIDNWIELVLIFSWGKQNRYWLWQKSYFVVSGLFGVDSIFKLWLSLFGIDVCERGRSGMECPGRLMSKVLLKARREERQSSAIANGRLGHGVEADDPTPTFLSEARPRAKCDRKSLPSQKEINLYICFRNQLMWRAEMPCEKNWMAGCCCLWGMEMWG